MQVFKAWIVWAALAALSFNAAAQEKRVALVIAQQNYTNGWGALPIVAQDRSLMATALRDAGFEVTIAENLQSKDALQNALIAFANKLDSPNGKSIGFIYYSGHGAADGGGRDARNYLIPTGTAMTTKPELVARALSLDDALEPVLAANTAAIFVALDACRNYPDAFSKSGVKGLAPVAVRPRMLIGFATQPGDTAPADGRYAQVLAQQIARAGVSGDQVFSDTQFEVARQTNEEQRPANYNNLTRKIVLSTKSLSGAAPSPASPSAQPSFDPRQVEVSFWESIKTSKNKADFEAYLKKYPNGEYVVLARNRGEELAASQPAVGANARQVDDPILQALLDSQTPAPKAAEPQSVGSFVPGQTFRDCPSCPEMVVVPAGRFMMGSPASELRRDDDEGPQREVLIAKPFAVGKFEVTFAEWDACVAGGGCKGYRPNDEGWGRGSRPVINVSWDDAHSYLRWVSEKSVKTYRLLSEAEWEYAARAGTATAYSWGRDPGQANANCDDCGSRWDIDWRKKQTAPRGSFRPNGFGLFDMHGSTWEWVEDCWNSDYAGAPPNGAARLTVSCGERVLRGGSWSDRSGAMRSANRMRSYVHWRTSNYGFRLARTL